MRFTSVVLFAFCLSPLAGQDRLNDAKEEKEKTPGSGYYPLLDQLNGRIHLSAKETTNAFI